MSTVAAAFKRSNNNYEFVSVKYHFIAQHGQKQLTEPEFIRVFREGPDHSKRQFWESTEAPNGVQWNLKLQIIRPEEADPDILKLDPFPRIRGCSSGCSSTVSNPRWPTMLY